LYVMALHETQNILLAIKLVLHSRKSYVLNQNNKWVLCSVLRRPLVLILVWWLPADWHLACPFS
jgi:hypothetical protein